MKAHKKGTTLNLGSFNMQSANWDDCNKAVKDRLKTMLSKYLYLHSRQILQADRTGHEQMLLQIQIIKNSPGKILGRI